MIGSGGGPILYRVREGIERFMITDVNNPAGSAKSQSEVPVMMDSLAAHISVSGSNKSKLVAEFNHIPGGANVLFMDGHVEFLKYPGQYPVTKYVAMKAIQAKGDINVSANFMNNYPGP